MDRPETEALTGEIIVAPRAALQRPVVPQRTLADLLLEVIQHGKSPQTKRAYRADLEDWLCFVLGRTVHVSEDAASLLEGALTRLQAITERDITAYREHLLNGGLAASTINRRLTPLRLLFRRLHRYHLIAVDPLEEVRGERLQSHSDTVWFQEEEARQLLAVCHGPDLASLRDSAMLRLMLRTGMRSRELLGLSVHDFTTVGRHQVMWVKGKGGARERIKVPADVWLTIQLYLTAAQITTGPVFRRLRRMKGPAGEPNYRVDTQLSYPGLVRIVRTRCLQAGLATRGLDQPAGTGDQKQPSPHSLRHSFVTLALQKNVPLPKVQAVVRHADPRTTMRYAHDLNDLDDNGVDGLSL